MDRETLVAHHIEALVGLGWQWSGSGLVPGPCYVSLLPNVDDQQLANELIPHPLGTVQCVI